MNIDVLALEGVFDTGLSAVLDTFGTANELAQAQGLEGVAFNVRVVGVRRRVRTAMGMTVPVQPPGGARPDWVVVPALNTKQPERLLAALARPDVGDARQLLQSLAGQGVPLAAACLGTFLVADAGLLDGSLPTALESVSGK